jgi:hypothetical protein
MPTCKVCGKELSPAEVSTYRVRCEDCFSGSAAQPVFADANASVSEDRHQIFWNSAADRGLWIKRSTNVES